jgi:DnaK suppressor protein
MLRVGRRAAEADVHSRIRLGRDNRRAGGGDDLEHSEADVQGDLTLALIQMGAGTVARIDQALARLEAGTYGSCAECGCEIDQRRLRALPFAVRCQACEAQLEAERSLTLQTGERRDGLPLFHDGTGF